MMTALAAPFAGNKIHWRPGSTTKDKSKAIALAYIDARDVMERLDEVVGPENWQREHTVDGKFVMCRIGIELHDAVAHGVSNWVWKQDGAPVTDIEAEKGGLSDAFKRAAVNWGVGRYLYDTPDAWMPLEARGRSYVFGKDTIAKLNAAMDKWTKTLTKETE